MEPDSITGLTADDFLTAKLQATLFTPDEAVSGAKILRELYPRWSTRFDAEPLVLPVSEDLPRELPRVVLRSSDGTWKCEIASARVNLHCSRSPDDSALQINEFFRVALPLLMEYRESKDVRVGRVASVATRFAKHSYPGRFLAEHFCQARWIDAPLNRPESFQLNAHKSYELFDGLKVNSWVKNGTGTFSSANTTVPAVLVEQDLNTLAEEAPDRDFDADSMTAFFDAVAVEFGKILRLYYPVEE